MHEFISAFTPITVSAVILAIALAATRLAPFTKPYWSYLPKKLQTWLPALVAGLPIAVSAFGSVKTWLDFLQALLVVGAVPGMFLVPGASSPHNHPELPPPAGTEGIVDHQPPSVPPPLDETETTPVINKLGPLVLLLAVGFSMHASACGPSKPPCDQAKLAAIVAVCTAQSQQCVSEGKSEAECSSLNECDGEIDRACGATK